MNVRIYYNPTCGTCQKVLAALKSKGIEPEKIEYLKTPPSVAELDELLKKLGMRPEELVRKKAPEYEENIGGRPLSRAEWLRILHEHPAQIERPIVVVGDRAIIARPPEKLSEIL